VTGRSTTAAGVSRERWLQASLWTIGAAVAICWPALVGSSYLLDVGTIALTFVVMGQTLNLLYGYAGYLCMAVPVFWGSGGFVAAHLVAIDGMNPMLAILIGGLAGAGVALLLGLIAMRGGRDSFAILTLILLVFAVLVANSWSFTGGAQGIAGLPTVTVGPHAWGIVIDDDRGFYYGMLLLTGVALGVMGLLVSSRWGKTLRATNVDERLAASFGVNLLRERLRAMTVGGLFCGLAGAFYVFSLTIADPSLVATTNLTPLFAIVFLGGPGRFAGVTIAAIAVSFLPQLTRDFQSNSNLVYGVLLVVLCLLFPEGLPEAAMRLVRHLRRAWRARSLAREGVLEGDAARSGL
jgi:branched-chain amino acid transport system permease protein